MNKQGAKVVREGYCKKTKVWEYPEESTLEIWSDLCPMTVEDQ